jgi:5'-nucleotidase / UDP-sugar diphosphatase
MAKSKILYINDFHSHVPDSLSTLNYLYLSKEDSFIVDTGDFTEGHPFYTLFEGVPEMKLMYSIFDCASPGNHGLQELIALSQRDFPVVNFHIFHNGRLLFRPTYIHQIGKYKVGFLGIMSKDAFLSIEKNVRSKLSYEDPSDFLPKLLQKIRARANFVILMSHSGFDNDKLLAEKYNGIDIICSGHCHSDRTEVIINNTLITKAPELGMGIGRLSFEKGSIQNSIIENKVYEFKPNKLLFLSPYLKNYEGYCAKELFFLNQGFSSKYHSRKLLMNYLVAKICEELNSDICLINYHCLRDVFPSGTITLGIISKCMPFKTILVRFVVSKYVLKEFITSLPSEINDFLCMGAISDSHEDTLSVITTDYLYNNYFQSLPTQQNKIIMALADYVVDHFSKASL